MEVKLLFFANLKNIISKSKIDLKLPADTTVLQLREIVLEMYPQIAEVLPNVIVSINQEFAFDEDFNSGRCGDCLFPSC